MIIVLLDFQKKINTTNYNNVYLIPISENSNKTILDIWHDFFDVLKLLNPNKKNELQLIGKIKKDVPDTYIFKKGTDDFYKNIYQIAKTEKSKNKILFIKPDSVPRNYFLADLISWINKDENFIVLKSTEGLDLEDLIGKDLIYTNDKKEIILLQNVNINQLDIITKIPEIEIDIWTGIIFCKVNIFYKDKKEIKFEQAINSIKNLEKHYVENGDDYFSINNKEDLFDFLIYSLGEDKGKILFYAIIETDKD